MIAEICSNVMKTVILQIPEGQCIRKHQKHEENDPIIKGLQRVTNRITFKPPEKQK